MPNIKSSIRSVKTDAERRAKNSAVKSQIRTASRKTVEAVIVKTQVGDKRRILTLERYDEKPPLMVSYCRHFSVCV